jgi:outer membrane receptor for ferrienterochelin and colicin
MSPPVCGFQTWRSYLLTDCTKVSSPYEIGDPDLKNEQNLAFNLQLGFHFGKLEFGVTPFYNLFSNYVYLAPTNEEWFGFPIYRYRQQDADQYGTEAYVGIGLVSGS